jgi:hypothetical protein
MALYWPTARLAPPLDLLEGRDDQPLADWGVAVSAAVSGSAAP